MKFDATITLGVVLQTVMLLTTIVIAVTRLAARLARVETQLQPLWKWFVDRIDEHGPAEDDA